MRRETLEQKRKRARQIIATLDRAHPDAKLALDFSNPLELLVALILAAQARDDLVNTVTPALFSKYRTARDYAGEKQEVLQNAIRKISMYRQKTRSIQRACAIIEQNFGGMVPENLEDLLTLPGVGRKTANAILGNAFAHPAIAVDRHVARVSGRLRLTTKEKPDEIETDLVQVVPRKYWVRFCHLLQFHGRRICAAAKPRCPECAINKLCLYPNKTKSDETQKYSGR